MRNRIRLFGGKKTEIFHLDNQVGAIAFIPVLNVIYYLLTLVTARQRRFALFLETVLLLAIGSLLIRLSDPAGRGTLAVLPPPHQGGG